MIQNPGSGIRNPDPGIPGGADARNAIPAPLAANGSPGGVGVKRWECNASTRMKPAVATTRINRKENKTTMGAKNAKNPNPHDCGILLPITDPKCAAFQKAYKEKKRLQKKKEAKKRANYDHQKEIEKRDYYWNHPRSFRGPG